MMVFPKDAVIKGGDAGWGDIDSERHKPATMRELVITLKGNESLGEFGKRLGVDPSTISLIIRGKRDVGMKVYRRLLAVYPDMREQFLAAMRREWDDNHK